MCMYIIGKVWKHCWNSKYKIYTIFYFEEKKD